MFSKKNFLVINLVVVFVYFLFNFVFNFKEDLVVDISPQKDNMIKISQVKNYDNESIRLDIEYGNKNLFEMNKRKFDVILKNNELFTKNNEDLSVKWVNNSNIDINIKDKYKDEFVNVNIDMENLKIQKNIVKKDNI
ncbi:MAG: hypothetical protein N4A54_13320 [Peptostreptococcaceae bacterium]|nr:hypothetical protein [Peptostreptococcaceae bacterium]